ncbi:MAG: aspartate carbamoyltransferase regulatory subunit [Candidatus Bathyarchaeota archaeon]|nr:aspartate carbamoyltransferase regulatory subunit [Candidatus Bathyarchaeota archaeon]
MSNKELLVSKIENGIVIDHIPAGRAFQALGVLKIDPDARALIALNVGSKSMGRKDFIKVEGSYLTSREIDVVAFVAPNATLNIIQDWGIKDKRKIKLPEQIDGMFKCPNPLCPTNAEYTPAKTGFKVEEGSRIEETKLHCTYCGSILYYGTILEHLTAKGFTLEGRGLVSQEKIERTFLDALIKGGALRFPKSPKEPFILKSGRQSPYFVNLGALTDGEDLNKLRFCFASYIALLRERGDIPEFDYVFGPSYKGISLAALTCEGLKDLYGIKKRYMYDRKEEKAYGDLSTDRVLVGANYFKPGQRILVVDDTITTGETKVDTFKKLEMLGDHKVVGVVIAVDRQEKMGDTGGVADLSAAQYMEQELGVKVFSIQKFTGIYKLVKDSLEPEMKKLWIDYYSKYGVSKLE